MLFAGEKGSLKGVALTGFAVFLFVAILLYILYNSSILPPVKIYGWVCSISSEVGNKKIY